MGILSNSLGWRDGRTAGEGGVTIRPATTAELDPAIRLVLGGQGATITDDNVREVLAFATERGIDLELLWIAELSGKPVLAALPVISPGRTALMFASPPPAHADDTVLAQVIDAVCAALAAKHVQMAQVLLDPADEVMKRIYTAVHFDLMAELIYLQGAPHFDAAPPVLPPHFRWVHYSERTHELFQQTILASYQQSLDCPALNGLRSMEDVIDGHKASGQFDPNHWSLLCQGERPMGVLLLASSGSQESLVELVYLGLVPEARGRKLGEILVRQAMATVAAEKHQRLSLAVDANNVPALKLYYRHGMNRVATKLALMRDLGGGMQARRHEGT